jgi:hypothetical protein
LPLFKKSTAAAEKLHRNARFRPNSAKRTEIHAGFKYYSDTEKRRVNETFTLNPEEGFKTEAEAMKRYNDQVKYRASTGYVHLFHFDPLKPNGVGYRFIG